MTIAARPLVRSLGLFLVLLASTTRAESEGPQLVGPFTADTYPQAVIDRPLTLPAGMVEGEMAARFTSRRYDLSFLGNVGTDDWDGDLAIRIGITDRLQVETGTSFSLQHELRGHAGFQGSPGLDTRPSLVSWSHVVPLRVSFLALDTDTLDTAVTLTLPFVAHASRTVAFTREGSIESSNGSGAVLPDIGLAAPTRWRLNDWLWLRAGEHLFAVSTVNGFAGFRFDLGFGLQLHRMVAVTLDTRIAAVAFDGSGHEGSTTLADAGTIALQGVFTPWRCFDVIGGLDIPNVGQGIDNYDVRFGGRVRF